jgi:hypothetical protein
MMAPRIRRSHSGIARASCASTGRVSLRSGSGSLSSPAASYHCRSTTRIRTGGHFAARCTRQTHGAEEPDRIGSLILNARGPGHAGLDYIPYWNQGSPTTCSRGSTSSRSTRAGPARLHPTTARSAARRRYASRATDILWTCTSDELYKLLVIQRSWSLARFGRFLGGFMITALLPPTNERGAVRSRPFPPAPDCLPAAAGLRGAERRDAMLTRWPSAPLTSVGPALVRHRRGDAGACLSDC